MITVYHAAKRDEKSAARNMLIYPTIDDVQRIWANRDLDYVYRQVATVATDSDETAFELTNTIDTPWWKNQGVTPVPGPGFRSTSVGDVFKHESGALLAVASIGFFHFDE